MHGWFQKILKSGKTKSTQHDRSKDGEDPVVSISSVSALSSSTSPSVRTDRFKPQQSNVALSSELRWRRKYDVFVCHSSALTDIEEATRLVLFLEEAPRSLRCFLWQRDTCPGGAVFTEFCQAVRESHIQALLITPSFVQDDWCNYMMHQALSEGPMSNRMIPVLQNLPHAQYPQELKFYYYIDLSKYPDQGFSMVNKTVHRLLENLVQNEMKLSCISAGLSCGLAGGGGTQEGKVVSEHDS
ncbi:toll/interleukin-1 receptor domain-containing adapter protein [Kryptolebias marmoratus]|uniref:Toll-interleukin 1 receptor (TIR) domain containing adaptor protein n=1 Tax=Kryptolebias marmoratus TaxID=37003 RepID=A0A3Q3EM87_KRYMA|nr:toll/interleukin-1 receptor domain-containing adapter protein [Kryptolebias marmoratus]